MRLIETEVSAPLTGSGKLKISDYFDLDSIPFGYIKRQAVDLKFYIRMSGYGNRLSWADGTVVSESVLASKKTLPTDYVKKELKRIFKFDDWQIVETVEANDVKLVVVFADLDTNVDLVITEMKMMGWTYSSHGAELYKNIPIIAVMFDPKYQKSVSDEARKFEFLYHWSPEYNDESISRYGLMPMSCNSLFSFPEHIHLAKGDISENDLKLLGQELCNNNRNVRNSCMYNLYSVEIDMVPKSVAFYYDPRYEYGFYTKRRIPADAVSLIGKLEFKKYNKFDTSYMRNIKNLKIKYLHI